MKRWLGLTAILLIAAVVAGGAAYRLQAPHRQAAAFNRVEVGMSRDEVIAIMGYPTGRPFAISRPVDELAWVDMSRSSPGNCYWVILDLEADRVIDKGRDQ